MKTGTDADANLVNLNSTTSSTISALRALTQPSTLPANNRLQPTETTVFVLNATLTQYKLETDSDYHLVLSDASGNTMIAEIPSPGCVGAGSPFAPQISTSRSTFNGTFTATTSFQTANIPVRVTGVGFFDFLHGQTGVAPNGIELHPVLNIVFNPSGSNPDFALSASGGLNIASGSSGVTTIFATPSGGFNSTLSLSASGGPTGATASFSSSTIPSGSGTSNLTVAVGAGVPAGSYTITVTATGGGLTHTLNVPLTVTSTGGGGGGELIADGGFESAAASGNSAPGWTGTTNISGHTTIVQGGSFPHSGTNYAYLGSSNNDQDLLTQTVAIPAGSSAALTFWVNVVTQETTTTTVYDTLAVEIHNTSGTLLSTPLTLSNLNAVSSNNTNGTYFKPASINLSAYAGQTINLTFHAHCDTSLPTVFRIDDVSLQGSGGSGGGVDTTPPSTSISSPANGATVSGTVTVSASATDNVGVTKMELYIDGTLAVSATSGPISYSWNTTLVANGSHSLNTKAYDAAGNIGTSSSIAVTVSNSSGVPQQLIGNPGFENGSANSTPWTGSAGVISNDPSEPPHSGSWDAWLDGYGTAHTDTLAQQVTIPSTITSATLSFWLHIDTAETSTTTAYDTLTVQVQSTSGAVLSTLATYSNLNANAGYAPVSFNLASFKGQTVKIVLTGTEDSSLQTSFVVDDFALNVQ